MQQQQQGQGGGGSQYRVSSSSSEIAPFAASTTQMLGATTATTTTTTDNTHQLQPVVEEASPISSRPPAGNFDELLPATGGDDDLFGAGDETDHRGGISGGNRWPRQETLALLKIRSEMDITFRDATLKGPLWEEVSRKLGELGYTRSAKKCKEKFENVQKYYKRTKEGRAGRQDGKSYRFFSELEALHGAGTATNTSSSMSSVKAAPISIGIGISNPVPVSSVRLPTIFSPPPHQAPPIVSAALPVFPHDLSVSMAPATITPPAGGTAIGISFSSTSSSSASESEEDDGDELEAEPSKPSSSRGRKRKRVSAKGGGGGSGTSNRMMEFFERLMKQVMQKQESMQQRFLDTIEKREHDRMIREEAWKRQETARLNREQEHMAQDRAIAASRDAAIITFLQKITGQNIQLPTAAAGAIPTTSPIPPPATVQPQQQQPPPPPPPPPQQHQQQPQGQQHRQIQPHRHHQPPNSDQVIIRHQLPAVSSEVFMAVPEQQVPPQETGGGSGSFDPTSSRWPKVEVLALIKLRSGLEVKYQEAGPKGPLWEEISAGMQRMGYNRSSKRCKEKWENINKYFKKVKESNKSRPEDAKTCPYFHELDALYRRKILGSTSGGGGGDGSSSSSLGNQNLPVQQQQQQQESMATTSQEQDRRAIMAAPQTTLVTESEINKGDSSNVQENNGGLPVTTLFGQGSSSSKTAGGGHKKPEDIVKELIEQQKQQQRQQLMTGDYDKVEEPEHSDDIDEDEDEDEAENDDDEQSDEEMKMAYKIEFQPKQNAAPSNRGGNGAPSFVAMVQ